MGRIDTVKSRGVLGRGVLAQAEQAGGELCLQQPLHQGRMCKDYCRLSGSSYYLRISYMVVLSYRFPIQAVHLLPMPSSVTVLTRKSEVEKNPSSRSNKFRKNKN